MTVPVDVAFSYISAGFRFNVSVGLVTVAVTATFAELAPALASTTLPEGLPALLVPATRTETVFVDSPLVCAKVSEFAKSTPLVETWKPPGAVTVKLLERFLAEVVKLWEAETDPEAAVNAGSALVETLMKGVVSGETVPFTAKILSSVPLLDTVTFPEKDEAAVVEAIRIVTVVGATDPPDRVIVRGKEV